MKTKFLVLLIATCFILIGCQNSESVQQSIPRESSVEVLPDTNYYYIDEFTVIDAKKDGVANTVTVDLKYYLNISASAQSSYLFKDTVTNICAIYQQYYFNSTLQSEVKEQWVGLTNDVEPEANLTHFVAESVMEEMKLDVFSVEDKRLFSCTIKSVLPKDNLISVYTTDQSRYSYSLQRELE